MNVRHVRANNPGPYTLDGTMSWVLAGQVIIDPGPADEGHVESLLEAATDLRGIFVTHRHADHAGSLPMLEERVSLPVYGPGEVQGVTNPVQDGERYLLGSVALTAVATPGHTGEHFCYLTDDRQLFTGDTVLGFGTTTIFLPDGNMNDYIASLEKLVRLRPVSIHPGHGPVREDAIELLEEYIEHRRGRERQVSAGWRAGARSPLELRKSIYPDLDDSLHHAAELQIEAHLEALRERDALDETE